MSGQYILDDDGNPVACDDLIQWATWLESSRGNRHVAETFINGVRVSTVFLGLDHSFGEGPPLLWEMMIFGGPHDSYQDRYSSLADAKAGHERAVELARTPPTEPETP